MELQIGKVRWYLGMHWNAFDTAPNFGEIRSEVEHLGANRYALRVSELAVQAGFANASSNNGAKAKGKVYSLAARLASAVAEPWFGVFDLGDGNYWYIAVRDGYSILPDGDVIGSSDEIELVRDSHSGFNDWKIVKGDIQTLEELLWTITEQENSGAIPKAKLVVVNHLGAGTQLPLRRIVIGVSAFCLICGALYWQKVQDEHHAQLVAQQARVSHAKALADQALVPLASPLPNEWLKACQEKLLPLQLAQHAWKLSQVSCDEKFASAQWKLTPGATVKERPEGALNPDGSQVDQSFDLQFSSKERQSKSPAPLEENLLNLRFIAQSSGMELQLATPVDQNPTALPGQISPIGTLNGNQTTNGLPKRGFVLTSKVAPFAIDFSSVPGMRITTLNSGLGDADGWKLEGTVYGR